jgi:hypothetical protein
MELIANFIKLSPQQFPWWWIVVGVVFIGPVVYFLVARRAGIEGK